jgi:hypothetical protein
MVTYYDKMAYVNKFAVNIAKLMKIMCYKTWKYCKFAF